jgi:SpoVK/Ycf46/Vps4 family AAA+-type ATPase
MPKRIYVPLPDPEARRSLITHLIHKQGPAAEGQFKKKDLDQLVKLTEGYSGSDLSAVCHEAALGPIRDITPAQLKTVKAEEVRLININDFINALRIIRPSVSQENLKNFVKWSEQFGVTR